MGQPSFEQSTAEKATTRKSKVEARRKSTNQTKTKHTPAQFAKTTLANPQTYVHQWFVLDAAGKTLGRFATAIADILRGKHRATYTTFADAGDGVIVINADKIKVTGSKALQKIYRHHTGAMSGMVETSYEVMMQKKPEHIIEHAVHGMVPRSRLGRQQVKTFKDLCRS